MRNLTSIGVDKETKARLKELAGGKPLARYLRELSIEILRIMREGEESIKEFGGRSRTTRGVGQPGLKERKETD